MITGVHALIFSPEADRLRTFLRDVLGFRGVDAGEGWLIFAMPPTELGVHPTMESPAGQGRGGYHELWLMCDDIETTVDELAGKGAEFVLPIAERGFGRTVALRLPDGGTLSLYEPRHPTAVAPES
jgi:catechol 2,3-dioxygenase-like lactoylglutathione lyase family enzyme